MSPTSVKPPFTAETALMKVKAAQDLWNSRDPARVATAYTEDSIWRNRDHFFVGREAIIKFLTDKWAHEHNYKLKKELFTFSGNKIAVDFFYEYTDTKEINENTKFFRTYGLEHWVFDNDSGLMKSRMMSGNTIEIKADERWFHDLESINDVEIPKGHISLKE